MKKNNKHNSLQSKKSGKFKISIIGAGNVGAAAAYALLISGIPTELCIIDSNKEKARGLEADFEQALSLLDYCKVNSSDKFDLAKDSELVIVTAGARQQPGESRLDLVSKNRKIFKSIIPQIAKAAPNSILLIVTNPVDICTTIAAKLSKFPTGRVFGTGTFLDTVRFQFHLSEKLKINPKSINAYILGEHGDSSFPVIESANIAGQPLLNYNGLNSKQIQNCADQAKNDAYHIINDLGFTCYSIAIVIREITEAIQHNSNLVCPVSIPLKNYKGISDIALSVPAIIGETGVIKTIDIPLGKSELANLKKSAEVLKKLM